jgi:hypothetical protein
MEIREADLEYLFKLTRSEQEKELFNKWWLCKINDKYFAGQFVYPSGPWGSGGGEVYFSPVPWNPSGQTFTVMTGWQGLWEILN